MIDKKKVDQGTHILAFLKSRTLIAPAKVEKAAKMPKGSLAAVMVGKRAIPARYYEKLANVLADYGYSYGPKVAAVPDEKKQMPFKELNVWVNSGGLHIYKNYSQLPEVLAFLKNTVLALELMQEDEVERYGSEFVVNSRVIEFPGKLES